MKRKTVRYAKTWIKNILTHTTSDKTNQEKKSGVQKNKYNQEGR